MEEAFRTPVPQDNRDPGVGRAHPLSTRTRAPASSPAAQTADAREPAIAPPLFTGNFLSRPPGEGTWNRRRRFARGNIGVPIGNGRETRVRLYSAKRTVGIVSDVPSEAKLTPAKWGQFRFE